MQPTHWPYNNFSIEKQSYSISAPQVEIDYLVSKGQKGLHKQLSSDISSVGKPWVLEHVQSAPRDFASDKAHRGLLHRSVHEGSIFHSRIGRHCDTLLLLPRWLAAIRKQILSAYKSICIPQGIA